jgi:hypothetical protein
VTIPLWLAVIILIVAVVAFRLAAIRPSNGYLDTSPLQGCLWVMLGLFGAAVTLAVQGFYGW